MVLLASFFPARGDFVPFFENLTTAAIALLFFMHGAKLSREAIIAGGGHWRLHLWVICSTFVLFPILGVLFAWWKPVNVDPMLYSGFLYLCILPATVQSAIAFTSMAGGNVAAAVCSASASSLLGIFLSPLLVGLVMNVHGAGGSLEQVGKIMLQLLLPFVLGHLSRPWIGDWVSRNKKWIAKTDQTSILLVVYTAFSEAVVNGIWHKVGWGSLLFIVVVSCVLLAIVIVVNVFMARRLGFNKADEITIVFCGIKRRPLYLPNGIIVLAISISCSFSISATQQTQHFRFVDDFNAQFLRFRQFRTCRFSGNHQIGFLRHAARDFRAQFNQSSFSVITRHLA